MRVTAALALVLLLAGCVPTPPAETPIASPSPTPVFASEEEALAAAEEAYAAYERAVDISLTTYDRSALDTVSKGQALQAALESSKSFEAQGRILVGSSRTEITKLAHPGGLVDGSSSDPLSAYACLDVSSTDVLDASGVSVVQDGRETVFPEVVVLEFDDDVGALVVISVEIWEGENFCD